MQAIPPGAEEQEYYYYGLPSNPKLIARTSTNIWANPQMPGPTTFTGTFNMYRKMLQPVGRHPLLHQLWNNANSSLRVQIIDAVGSIQWNAIDILRIGFPHEDSPITLMIAVTPDTLSWSQGYTTAAQCKSILEQHGIYGVECEIRESVVTFLTQPDEKTLQLSSNFPDSFSAEHRDGPIHAQFTDYLGTRIAIKDKPSHAGTKGIYLSLAPSSPEGKPMLVALTCRHVVIHTRSEGIQTYRRPESGPFKDIIQVDQPTFESELEILEAWTANGKPHDSSALLLRDTMKPLRAPSSRVFGRVLFSPEFSCSTAEGSATWLKDWAIIELEPTSHQAPLNSITNRIFIGPEENFASLVRTAKSGWKGLPTPKAPEMNAGCFNLLKEVVPCEELFNPPGNAEYFDEPAICVAKYGPTSGLTIGLGNTLKSVTRTTDTPDGGREYISEEWPIISVLMARDRAARFSEPGDSGSCVWDMEGRPAGIVMAGNGINGMNDVTYASPLERLLADIKSHGFEVSLV